MKTVVKATALSLALAFASSAAVAAENIAFLNAGVVFQNHPDRPAIAKKLDEQFKDEADKLAASKKAIDAKIDALQKEAKNLRSADIKKREDEINKLMREQDDKARKFQQKTQQVEREETAKLLESIQKATNDFAKEKGYTYVLDANSVVYALDGKDITEDILTAVGGKLPAEPKDSKPTEAPKAK